MKVLVVGSGGREYSIAKACVKSNLVSQVYVLPGSDSMKEFASVLNITGAKNILEFAILSNIDLTIIGPENYLNDGIVDMFKSANLKVFGPTKNAALIETSKEYSKYIMNKYQIPTASYKSFSDYNSAYDYLLKSSFPAVLKYDGLASGKGVSIVNDLDDAKKYLNEVLNNQIFGSESVLVEEFLTGIEFTLMAFVCEDCVNFMEISQDYKQIFNDDLGPNTGGMGVCSPITSVDECHINQAKQIMKNFCVGLKAENNSFTGFLYGGFMKTAEGVKVIEFNARFGDPEAEVLLYRLESDFVEIILNTMQQKNCSIIWSDDYAIGVVLASKGYPNHYQTGDVILNIPSDCVHMNTKLKKEYHTAGGRVLLVLGKGSTISSARESVYKKISSIKCESLIYRTDIGKNA